MKFDEYIIPLFFFLAVVFLFVTPFVVIWSLNTLFNLGIPYTYETYLAMLFLLIIILPLKFEYKKKKVYYGGWHDVENRSDE